MSTTLARIIDHRLSRLSTIPWTTIGGRSVVVGPYEDADRPVAELLASVGVAVTLDLDEIVGAAEIESLDQEAFELVQLVGIFARRDWLEAVNLGPDVGTSVWHRMEALRQSVHLALVGTLEARQCLVPASGNTPAITLAIDSLPGEFTLPAIDPDTGQLATFSSYITRYRHSVDDLDASR